MYAVSFEPTEDVDHTVNITFNNELVPDAPFMARMNTSKINEELSWNKHNLAHSFDHAQIVSNYAPSTVLFQIQTDTTFQQVTETKRY